MFRPKAYIILALLLLSFAPASAQERVWNAALDWYENVCGRCADWMDKIERGESVPKDSLQHMLGELTAVRQNLQGVWGEMSPGQRLRFEVIRDRFASGRWNKGPRAHLPALPVMPDRSSRAVKMGVTPLPGYKEYLAATHRIVRPRIRPGILAGLAAGVYPDFSAGVLCGVALGNWAFFAKARGNVNRSKAEYDCLSDGTIEGGGYFWSGDAKESGRLQMTVDVAYKVVKPLSLYAGAGYGSRTLCWKDWNGAWARVTDRCFSGFAADAGILVHPIPRGAAQGLTLLLGCSWVAGGYLDAEAGVCWRF